MQSPPVMNSSLIHTGLFESLPTPYILLFKTTYGKREIFRYQVKRLHRLFGGEITSLISFSSYQMGSSSEMGLCAKCLVQWHPHCAWKWYNYTHPGLKSGGAGHISRDLAVWIRTGSFKEFGRFVFTTPASPCFYRYLLCTHSCNCI